MPRKLGAPARPVKRGGAGRGPGFAAALGYPSFALWLVLGGCGGAAPKPPPPDPYGARIGACIDADRAQNDAAQGRMLRVPGGPAVLGSTAQERAQARLDYGADAEGLFENEAKVRRAHVHDFRMDRAPVTAKLYAEFVASCGMIPPDAESVPESSWQALAARFAMPFTYAQVARFLWTPKGPELTREQHPMVLVTQDEAAFYCAWRGARLPTEEEWERAARGRNGRIYPWGERYDPFRVNTAQTGTGDTMPVGSMPHGHAEEGFTDMGGLVFEWTSTPWPGRPGYFVAKGNGWNGRGGFGRGAARVSRHAEQRDPTLGFRCAYSN